MKRLLFQSCWIIALFASIAANFAVGLAAKAADATAVSFELDVQPILTSRGCNQGACHGKSRGQNGFQLSLLGFDSNFDYDALTKNARGRRIFLAAPERSLLLQKGSGQIPHGGGVRIEPDGADYETLRRWISQGAPRRVENEPKLVRIEMTPAYRLLQPNETMPLTVKAFYSDSSSRDVTANTSYQSNEAGIVAVDKQGLVKAGPLPGEATVMARYMYLLATCNVAIPLPGSVPDSLYTALPVNNFIDKLAWEKMKSLGITPSPPCDDATFLRRAHLDVIGRLPTPDEVRAFIADADPNKRAKLIDTLLQRPEYADYWASKWADLLRPNPYRVGVKAVLNYDAWIRDNFRKNKPYDQFVRELITAQGSTWRNGAATLFRDRRDPEEITTMVSQLFLGIRLECAKCHHHPFEKWGQDDFYSFAAHFARIGRKGQGISPPISGSEEMILTAKKGEVKHPLTGEVLPPRPLFELAALPGKKAVESTGDNPDAAEDTDPRDALATWVTSDQNPFFAQVIVNRVWADLLGRGLVEPVDDLRATNPASNTPLLEALAAEFRKQRYDLQQLIRTICTSQLYGLSATPVERNVSDTRNYSRHYRVRVRAEVLLDAVTDITGLGDSFAATPAGSRANEIWTTRIGSVFLDTFGRPNPNQDPPCERTADATVTQTLHLMNAPQLHQKVTADNGRAAKLAAGNKTPDQITDEIYLLVYSRFPTAEEQEIGRHVFAEKDVTRRQAAEDLMWALINTPEFIFRN